MRCSSDAMTTWELEREAPWRGLSPAVAGCALPRSPSAAASDGMFSASVESSGGPGLRIDGTIHAHQRVSEGSRRHVGVRVASRSR